MHRQPLEKAETMPEAGDETREAKSAQVTEPNMLRGMNRSVPAEAIEGVVKRIDLARPEIFWPTRKRSQMSFEGTDETPSTGAVDQVVGGIRRQHVSRSSSRSMYVKKLFSPDVSSGRSILSPYGLRYVIFPAVLVSMTM